MKFLLIRFSAIGDCVMAAWAATAIRHKHPDAFLCWAIESRCAPVVDRHALASRVYEFPRDRWKKKRWSPHTWREQMLAYARLRQMNFDYGIDLQGHSKTALCLRIAKPAKRVQARATDSLAARLNPMIGEPPEGMHTVEWNHKVLQTLGEFELPPHPIMPDPSAPEVWGPDPKLSKRISISVSAGQADKSYPADQWRTVAEELLKQGHQVVFLGGPTDQPILLEGAEDYVGKLGLDKTMSIVATSDLHLAADTGTGHMAAAYGVPVVSVFGPTDYRSYRPYTTYSRVLREGSSTGDVKPEQILAAAHELLEGQ
ncbi:MAG TPA: glycosyltransferase family 9 protein [Fimbriimonas sp.]|nr:glycosyltransferase family 9 protein [Fimbriimonas sp.]